MAIEHSTNAFTNTTIQNVIELKMMNWMRERERKYSEDERAEKQMSKRLSVSHHKFDMKERQRRE